MSNYESKYKWHIFWVDKYILRLGIVTWGFPGLRLAQRYVQYINPFSPLYHHFVQLPRYLCKYLEQDEYIPVRELIKQEELKPQALQSYVIFIHSEIILYEFSIVGTIQQS